MVGRPLTLACLRYASTLALHVRRQMRSWHSEALALSDPGVRYLALEKLDDERFNAEAAAMAATIAPSELRRAAATAIVALEVMFDYLDGLTERPLDDPIRDGERLHSAFLGALQAAWMQPKDRAAAFDAADAYLHALACVACEALAQLPAWEAVASVATECATDAVQAQVRMHAAGELAASELQEWAMREARERSRDRRRAGVPWRDFAAGAACSVLTLHALIAAAADRSTTRAEAEDIRAAYAPLCTAITLLDGLTDAHRDGASGTLSYAGLYDSPQLIGDALRHSVSAAIERLAGLRRSSHHLMMLASAIAYETSSARWNERSLSTEFALALEEGHRSLLLAPSIVLRGWRLLKDRGKPAAHRLVSVSPPNDGKPLRSPTSPPNRERTSTC